MNMSIIMPAYNEELNIAGVLKQMPKKYNIIVVDDGSTDNTSSVVKKMGFRAVRLEKNMGKGRACLAGIRHSNSEFNVFIDADGQLDVAEVNKFEKALRHADIVIGQRSMKDIPLQRRISNIFARKMISMITGYRLSDALCGFRAVRKSSFQRLRIRKGHYYFESEMLIEAAKRGLKVATVDVSVDYSRGSRMSILKSFSIAGWLLWLALKRMVRI